MDFFSSLKDLKWGFDCIATALLTLLSIVILAFSSFYPDNKLYELAFIALFIIALLGIFFPSCCTIKGDNIIRKETKFIESKWILLLNEYTEESPHSEPMISHYQYGQEIKLVKQNLQKRSKEYYKNAKIHAAIKGEEEIALTFLAKAIEIDEKYKASATKEPLFNKFKEKENFKWLVG